MEGNCPSPQTTLPSGPLHGVLDGFSEIKFPPRHLTASVQLMSTASCPLPSSHCPEVSSVPLCLCLDLSFPVKVHGARERAPCIPGTHPTGVGVPTPHTCEFGSLSGNKTWKFLCLVTSTSCFLVHVLLEPELCCEKPHRQRPCAWSVRACS